LYAWGAIRACALIAAKNAKAPRGRSRVGSLTMGFAFGWRGHAAPPAGRPADIDAGHTALIRIAPVSPVIAFRMARLPALKQ